MAGRGVDRIEADHRLERGRDAGDRRPARAPRGAADADPARRAGGLRLRAARGDPGDRAGAEPVAGRGLWRRHLLSRLPRRPGRAARGEALPRRGLPVDGLRGAGGAGRGAARHAPAADERRTGVTLEAVYCLGLCATGPSAMVDGQVVGRLDAGRSSTRCSTRCGHDPGLRPARCRRGRLRRRGGRGGDRAARRGGRGSTSSSCATGRAGCCGWSRWSRSRTAGVRYGFGPLDAAGAEALVAGLAAGRGGGVAHPQALGPVEAIPFFARQTRLTFARCGITDPVSLDDYAAHGGWLGLRAGARSSGPRRSSPRSRPRGCAGAAGRGFPTGIKWKTVRRDGGAAEVRRLQRRRGRQRHLRRPDDHGGRSLPADRGDGDRRDRGRGDARLHLPPLGVSARGRGAGGGDRRGRGAPAGSARGSAGSAHAFTSRCGSAPGPTSAARRPRCSTAWRASAASCGRSRRCRRTRGCSGGRR